MKPEGVALVTGASRGLGRVVAVQLAVAGFDVVATMRDPSSSPDLSGELEAAAEEAGTDPGSLGTVTVGRVDVDHPETIDLPADLRVLVNNAGIERRYLPVEAVPMDEWRSVFETNVFGLVEITRRAVPILRANGGGVVCNVTSSSLLVPAPFYSVYRASKAAVQALGESLRTEVAPFGIRVVEIMPGPVDTDMLALSAREPEAATEPGYEEMARAAHQGRLAVDDYITPAPAAARAVVDAIVSEAQTLRWPCDELGGQLLTGWRADPEASFGGA